MLELDLWKPFSRSKIGGKIPHYLCPTKENCVGWDVVLHMEAVWHCLCFISAAPARLRVLKNGESDESRAVTVVGPDLTNVSSNCLLAVLKLRVRLVWCCVELNYRIVLTTPTPLLLAITVKPGQAYTPQDSALMNLLCEKWIP